MCTLAGFRTLHSIVYLSFALLLTACFSGDGEIRTIVLEDSDDRSVSSVPVPDSTTIDEPEPASDPTTIDEPVVASGPTASEPVAEGEAVAETVPSAPVDEPVVAVGPRSITDLVLILSLIHI